MARATAESSQRRAAKADANRPARARVRDFSGTSRAQTVSFDPRAAYDFLISAEIGAAEENDLLPDDRAWLVRSRGSLDDKDRGALDTCFGDEHKSIFQGLSSMVVERPEVRTAADVVAAVGHAGWRGIAAIVLRDNVEGSVPDALIARVIDRDAEAIQNIDAHLNEHIRGEVPAFLDSSQEQFPEMQRALTAWLPRFEEIEARIARFEERDVTSRRADQRTLSSEELIEHVTGGLRWIPDAHIQRTILAPSYFARPFNYIYQGANWRLFAYPITDAVLEAADSAMPPPSVVRLFRTLGDPTRLRTLKLLADRDWYLTELAAQLELSKPTMKHHLAQMRAAGLVTVTEEGGLTYYSLRRDRLADAGIELTRFIG